MKNNIKNNHEFNPHEITWSQEKASRIWDYLSSKKSYHEKNFARLVGEEIINLIKAHGISLRGNALDYGCGPGFFLEKLLEEDICCYGADFSKRSVALSKAICGSASYTFTQKLTPRDVCFNSMLDLLSTIN